MYKKSFSRMVLVLLLATTIVGLAGCPSKYHTAAAAANDLSLAAKTIQDAEIAAHHEGLVSTDEDIPFQRFMLKFGNDGAALTDAIANFKGKRGVVQNLDVALDDLNQLTAVTSVIHNPQARVSIQTAIVAAKGLLDTISAALK